eukprot:scaffold193229_cov31-Tisochrysis_lutea.AAC.1
MGVAIATSCLMPTLCSFVDVRSASYAGVVFGERSVLRSGARYVRSTQPVVIIGVNWKVPRSPKFKTQLGLEAQG